MGPCLASVLVLLVAALQPLAAADPLPRGSRELAVDVNQAADGDYLRAFAAAQRLSIDSVGISLDWKDVETAPGVYDTALLEVVNAFYPPQGMAVTLTIRPIHTTQDTRPADLQGLALDDPAVIDRFGDLLVAMAGATPEVEWTAIAIGSEIDLFLGQDAAAWGSWNDFYIAAVADVRAAFGSGVPIGSEVTRELILDHPATIDHWWAGIHAAGSDFMALSYYHHLGAAGGFMVEDAGAIGDRIDAIVAAIDAARPAAAGDLPLRFTQFGMPSAPVLGSSEAEQAAFVAGAFEAWDAHAARIVQLDFTWMHDLAPEQAEDFAALDGGAGNEAFVAFLATLGLRHRAGGGVDKPAWQALLSAARARGWTTAADDDFTIQEVVFHAARGEEQDTLQVRGSALPAAVGAIRERVDLGGGESTTVIEVDGVGGTTRDDLEVEVLAIPVGGG